MEGTNFSWALVLCQGCERTNERSGERKRERKSGGKRERMSFPLILPGVGVAAHVTKTLHLILS